MEDPPDESLKAVTGANYLNASFVDVSDKYLSKITVFLYLLAWQGYRRCNAFIVAQSPLKETVNDFWKMIWEQNCYSVVMLTPLKEEEKVRQLTHIYSEIVISCLCRRYVISIGQHQAVHSTIQ